ncbi:endospore germination permease [Brevibacillus sp. GCM10020057]|uniref:GerAB/ArcD/ProY family transporter n=1 Tax=Brevibacillus sp. GCM10020057 TaxID=3317327 RepID=UPI0036287336
MRKQNGTVEISPIQNVMLVFGTIVGVGFISMPRGAVEKAHEDAWITVLLACVFCVFSLWLILSAASVFPEDTVIESNRKVFGRLFGFLLNVLLIVYFVFFTVTGVRTMAEVVRAQMLPFTPLEVIIVAMLLTLFYSSWDGLGPIVRINESGLPITFVLILLFFTLAYLEADWNELRIPFLEGIRPVIQPLPSTVYSFLGFEILFLYYPFLANKKRAFLNAAAGIGLAGGFYVFIVLGTLVTLGPDVTITQTYPVITMSKMIEVVRQFVERAELLLIILWMPLAYTTHLSTFFSAAFCLHRTFPRISYRWWIVVLFPCIYFLTLVPDNLQQMDVWSKWVGNAGIFLLLVYPVLFLVIAKIRRKFGLLPDQGKEGEQSAR